MSATLLAAIISAAISLAGVLIAAAVKTRADAVEGYASLVNSLQKELSVQRDRLAAFEAMIDLERAAWAEVRAELEAKISEQAARIERLEAAARREEGDACP